MLVNDIKLVKKPKRIVNSFEWFKSINRLDSALTHTLCFLVSLLIVVFRILGDWKVDSG